MVGCYKRENRKRGDTMQPRHTRCVSSRSLIALAAIALTATLSCAPPSEDSHSSRSPDTEVGVSRQLGSAPAPAGSSFTLFESGQVRPLAMSPDKKHLFAVNTPDNRLEIFRIKPNRIIHTASIP